MDLKSLVLNFFKGMNCNIQEGNILIIKNVPENFEKLYGKSSPYQFVFDVLYLQPETELITNSCNLIKTINDYLKNKAKTTVLKLEPKTKLIDDLSKYLILNNYNILNITKKEEFDYVFRFTFETLFQYLNENEKIINQIYVHESGTIDNFQIENYETVNGEKEDIQIKDLKDQSNAAKEKARELLKEKIQEISNKLKESLEIELKRIENHYNELLKETNTEIKKNQLKIKELNEKKPEDYSSKIQRLNGIIEKLIEKSNQDQVNPEKNFQIKNEKQKHSLGISTKLLNKVVIYYPIYSLNISFKDKNTQGTANFKFNSLTKQIQDLKCHSCQTPLLKIKFCSSNHLTCDKCSMICGLCMSEICLSCNKETCNVCGRDVCKNCRILCDHCKKPICNEHIRNDFLNSGHICSGCSETCSKCGKSTDKDFFKKINYSPVCPKCFGKKLDPLKEKEWGV